MDDDDREANGIEEDERPAFRTGQVRIFGAEPAGRHVRSDEPPLHDDQVHDEVPEEPVTGSDAGPAGDPTSAGETGPASDTEMPHWTEAPTGQVPAVLAREGSDEPTDVWSSLPGPTWREEHADWAAHEETFEPSMLAHEEDELGGHTGEERQPWSFDLPDADQSDRGDDSQYRSDQYPPDQHDTMVVPAVTAYPEDRSGLADEPGAAGEPRTTGRIVVAEEDGDRVDESLASPDEHEPAGARSRRSRQGIRAGDPRPTHRVSSRPGRRLAPPEPPSPEAEPRGGRNLPVAIGVGVVLFLLVLVLFHLGTIFAMVAVTVAVTLGAAEAYAAFRRGGYHPATLLGLVATISVLLATYNKGQAALPLVLVLLVAFTFVWYMAGVEREPDVVRGVGATLLVFCWISVFGSFAALLLDPTLFPHRHGIAFLLGAIVAAAAYDIGALAVGARLGSHPLAASISPNKTWEGFFGGAVASVAVSLVVLHFVHPWSVKAAAALGVTVAIVSPIGDLIESYVKRHLGLKDMGRILPGHGGILDRIDGLLLVLPATYYLVKAFHLG